MAAQKVGFTPRLLRQVALAGKFQAQLHWNQSYISELHIRATYQSCIGIRATLESELRIRAALESELHWNIGIRASYQSYISELSLKLTS